jgi:hypothetical protein
MKRNTIAPPKKLYQPLGKPTSGVPEPSIHQQQGEETTNLTNRTNQASMTA